MADPKSGTTASPGTARPLRILLAEDDPEYRILLSFALEEEGYEVLEAANGRELISILSSLYFKEREPVDLIISDVCMPELNIVRAMAAFRRWWTTPWILMTDFGNKSIHTEAQRVGASLVIDKPFLEEDLRDAIFGLTSQ